MQHKVTHQFDLVTHRFIVNRWKSPTGREVRDKLIETIKSSHNVNEVLEPYVLKHPSNLHPREFPFYPPDAIAEKEFWVISNDDLRGIHLHNEDFAGTTSLAKTNLTHAYFEECVLTHADFEMTDLSYAYFIECDLNNSVFAHCMAYGTHLINSKLVGASFLGSRFKEADFSGSDLHDIYFEDTQLIDIKVNYLTKFNKSLHKVWHARSMPVRQLADLYRAIRIAYHKAELYHYADHYMLQERNANRKYVLWPRFMRKKKWSRFLNWGKDFFWGLIAGYGIRPARVVLVGIIISLIYAVIYYLTGNLNEPTGHPTSFLAAVYYSFTTFATLGYGDITFEKEHHILRLVSTSEAMLGAVLVALFVVVLARKLLR